MPTLRLVYGDETPEANDTPDVYPFPSQDADEDCPWEIPTDSAAAVERAITLVQEQIDDLSTLLDPIPFPGREDDPPPTAA